MGDISIFSNLGPLKCQYLQVFLWGGSFSLEIDPSSSSAHPGSWYSLSGLQAPAPHSHLLWAWNFRVCWPLAYLLQRINFWFHVGVEEAWLPVCNRAQLLLGQPLSWTPYSRLPIPPLSPLVSEAFIFKLFTGSLGACIVGTLTFLLS